MTLLAFFFVGYFAVMKSLHVLCMVTVFTANCSQPQDDSVTPDVIASHLT